MLYKILTVVVLATFEIYAAVPTGFAFGLSPWVIFFSCVSGGIIGVFITAFLGKKIRAFFSKGKTSEPTSHKHPTLFKIWNKYGIIGLSFLGTMSVGAPISIAIGVSLNANIKIMILWCCVAVICRCFLFTFIGHHGLKLFS